MFGNLARSSLILIIFTLLSKLMVIFRDMIMASVFGASSLSDAYVTAITILSLISVASLSAITVAYIPIISGKDDRELSRITNNFLTVLSVLTLAFSMIAMLFSRYFVQLFASGFKEETIKQTQLILYIVLPILFCSVILSITISYLQYKGFFGYQGVSAIIANSIIILSLLVCRQNLKILAGGYALSIVVPAVIGLLLARNQGLRGKLVFSIKNRYLRELLILSIPIFLSQVLIQLNIIIDKNFSSQIGIGMVTNLDYAHKIANTLVSAIIPPIATVLYPTLSKYAAGKDNAAFSDTLRSGLQVSALISTPLMIGAILFAQPIVHILLLRGNYSLEAANITAKALSYYGISILPSGFLYILNNGFFAQKDTKTPLVCGAFAIILNIILNFALIRRFSFFGLAAATSVSTLVNAILYLICMKKKTKGDWLRQFLISLCKIAVSSVNMVLIIILGKSVLFSKFPIGSAWNLAICIGLGGAGCIVYILTCYFLKEESTRHLFQQFIFK